jgi:outer membrane protein
MKGIGLFQKSSLYRVHGPTRRAMVRVPARAVALLLMFSCLLAQTASTLANAQTANSGAAGPAGDGAALTLPIAIDIALRTNPLVRATTSGEELAAAQVDEAKASRFPLLQFNQTFTRSNNPVFVFGSLLEQGRFGPENFAITSLNSPDSLNNVRTSLAVRIPIFDQRQSSTLITQAELGRKQAEAQSEMVRQQLRFDVLKAYYALLVSRARIEVADEAVKLGEADAARIRDMFDTGMVVQSDLLAVEVQTAEFRQQQIAAEGEALTAQAALNTALGISIDTPQKIAGELVEKSFLTGTQEELIRLAISNRPETARSRLAFKSALEGTRGAKRQSLPRIDFFGAFGVSGQDPISGSSDYTVGVSLTLNIFDAGRKARLTQARAAEAAAAANEEDIARQIRFEVVRSYQQYVSARERTNVASRVVEQAREALRIVRDRYESGLTTITEVLRAQTAFVRSRLTLLSARYEHYVGYAGVLLATGTLIDVQQFVS